MGDDAFRIAQIVGDLHDPERVLQAESRLLAAFDLEGDHLPAARHLLSGDGRLGVVGASAVDDARDAFQARKRVGDDGGAGALCLHPDRQRLEALQHDPGVERAQGGAGLADEVLQVIGQELLAAEHRAAEAAALAVDVLGRRIDHDVGAVGEGALQHGRCEHIVDHGRDAVLLGERGDGADVDEVERGVGRRLEEERLRVGTDGGFPVLDVAAVDQRHGDAKARAQGLDDVTAGAEHGARGDDVVAGLQERQQARGDGGHAGGGGAGHLGAFQKAHALLEHGDRRVGEARILETRILVLETRFRLLGGLVDEALGQEERFGGLAELGAQHAAVHELRLGAPARGVVGDRLLVCGHGGVLRVCSPSQGTKINPVVLPASLSQGGPRTGSRASAPL